MICDIGGVWLCEMGVEGKSITGMRMVGRTVRVVLVTRNKTPSRSMGGTKDAYHYSSYVLTDFLQPVKLATI
jgi:hypothetical protein